MGKIRMALRVAGLAMRKNSPKILAALAVTGVCGTGIFATKAGMKAKPIIDKMKAEGATTKEIIRAVAPIFAPSVLMGATTIGCIVGSTAIEERRNAVYASLLSTSELALTEYQKKTLDAVGEKAERAIRDSVSEQKVVDNPVSERKVIATGDGDSLCYDAWSDRYFTSNIEKLRQAENTLNQRIICHMWITLNEVYSEINLNRVGDGDNLGFNVDHLVKFRFSSTIADDGRPCLVVEFDENPRPWNN